MEKAQRERWHNWGGGCGGGGLRRPRGQGKKVFQGEESDQLCLKLQLVPVM